MQVSLNTVIRSVGLVPLIHSPLKVSVGTLDSTESDGVAVVEPQGHVVDLEIHMKPLGNHPVQLGKAMSKVVVEVVFKSVADP